LAAYNTIVQHEAAKGAEGEPSLAPQRQKKQSTALRLERLDKRYIWHPFTQMRDWEKEPQIIIESGKGSTLTDVHGKKYIDGVSSLWVTVHGHRKKEIDAAVSRQLKKIAHSTLLGLSNVPAVMLAEKLVNIAPKGLSKVFYSDSGSTAVEIALKIAFQYWQQKGPRFRSKTKFISLTEAYHGDTLGSVSVGGISLFHSVYKPLLFQTRKIESPFCYRCAHGLSSPACRMACLAHAEKTIRKYASDTAALIIEPLVQGAAGMLMQPPGYLKGIRELCTKYGIIMIADEVATGFGRTGTMFACEHEDVAPDIMCVAKGITGGYLPLAATLTTEEIYGGFLAEYRDMKTFFHGHTYTGNPLACAASIASLELFIKENVLEKLQPKIAILSRELELFKKLRHVGEVRQKGFMAGIELVQSRKTKKPYPLEHKAGIRVTLECRRNGLIIRPLGNVVVLMPPLAISVKELKLMTGIVFRAIKTVTETD
jgi:adenosylmethionine-8-amino-7-oxononanoate aminotransferase